MKKLFILVLYFLLTGCASRFLDIKKQDEAQIVIDTSEELVKIEESPLEPLPEKSEVKGEEKKPTKPPVKSSKKEIKKAGKKEAKKDTKKEVQKQEAAPVPLTREPVVEDSEGFIGASRKPPVNPFRINERLVHRVSYFGATAGKMTFATLPFAQVNGKKTYRFKISVVTDGIFNSFYKVDDYAETYLDYETLVPYFFKMNVRESGQIKQAQQAYLPQQKKMTFIEKKYTEKKGHETKELSWEVPDYVQNVFSAFFYMRIFKMAVGKEISFYIADDGKNFLSKAKVIRQEKVKTQVGEFDCMVLKPEVSVNGEFKPVGDIYIWLSNDDRKIIVKIESEIKIGTVVSELIEWDRGVAITP